MGWLVALGGWWRWLVPLPTFTLRSRHCPGCRAEACHQPASHSFTAIGFTLILVSHLFTLIQHSLQCLVDLLLRHSRLARQDHCHHDPPISKHQLDHFHWKNKEKRETRFTNGLPVKEISRANPKSQFGKMFNTKGRAASNKWGKSKTSPGALDRLTCSF